LNIENYNVRISTLEEVFNILGQKEEDLEAEEDESKAEDKDKHETV